MKCNVKTMMMRMTTDDSNGGAFQFVLTMKPLFYNHCKIQITHTHMALNLKRWAGDVSVDILSAVHY